jgi:hypothetical protein
MALKLRRGLEADRSGVTPAEGEIIYTTDQKQLFVGDGTTAGGTLVSSAVVSVNAKQGVVVLTTDDVAQGATNKYFSNTLARDAISVTGTGGTYNPTTGVIDLTGGGATYAISAETTTGGVNLRLTGSDTSTDNVKFAQGSNITLTRTDANTITIASTATSSVQNLNDLIDVEAASPSNGQALVWNSGSSTWTAAAVGSGTIGNGITNQLAYYTDTNTLSGSTKFTIDTSRGDLLINEGGLFGVYAVLQTDSNLSPLLILNQYHNNLDTPLIAMQRARGNRTAPQAVQIYDSLGKIYSLAHDGVKFVSNSAIETYVSGAITNGVAAFEATLATGTAIVTLTAGVTTGLVAGQSISKQSGVGTFGTNWNGLPPYIISVDSPTQLTLSINHAVAGAVVFDVDGIIPSTMALSSTMSDGRIRRVLKLENNGSVTVGPSVGDYDGTDFTGAFTVLSMKGADVAVGALYPLVNSAIKIGGIFDGARGQEIAFSRVRGTVTQGGGVATPSTVLTGDELGSLAFYGYNTGTPGVDNLLSSRIVSEVSGTVTSTALPGKLTLQTANNSGTLTNGLTVDRYQMTTFGGMAKIATYANETAANDAVGGTPTNGMMYYDSGANVAKMYGNSAWHALW